MGRYVVRAPIVRSSLRVESRREGGGAAGAGRSGAAAGEIVWDAMGAVVGCFDTRQDAWTVMRSDVRSSFRFVAAYGYSSRRRHTSIDRSSHKTKYQKRGGGGGSFAFWHSFPTASECSVGLGSNLC